MNKNGYGSRHEDKDKIIFSAPKIGDSNAVPPSWWEHYCRPKDSLMSFPLEVECDWCNATEDK